MLRIAQKVRSFARRSLSSLGLRPPSAFAWPKTANTSDGDARYICGGALFQALKSAASRAGVRSSTFMASLSERPRRACGR